MVYWVNGKGLKVYGSFDDSNWNLRDVLFPLKSFKKSNKESKEKEIEPFLVAVILNASTERSKNLPDTQKERAMQT